MIIKFDKRIVERTPEVYAYIANSRVRHLVAYVLNSTYRKAVQLSPWIQNQLGDIINTPPLMGKDHDDTVMNVLVFVRKHLRYVPDNDISKPLAIRMREYWQTAKKTFELKTGDCEDGAILAYVLCRQNGVPAERLQLIAGDVQEPNMFRPSGHAYLAYKPSLYPLNWVFLDWCYWYTNKSVEQRNKFFIHEKNITEYKKQNDAYSVVVSSYKDMWFSFNEDGSHLFMRHKGVYE